MGCFFYKFLIFLFSYSILLFLAAYSRFDARHEVCDQ